MKHGASFPAAAIAATLFIQGCGLAGAIQPEGMPVREAYDGGHELRVMDVDSPLRAEKRIPVLSAPEVFAAYVPAHVSGDLMIGDHWIFFKLREARWFVERLQDPDPPAEGDAPPELMKPMRDLDWRRVAVPHKAGP